MISIANHLSKHSNTGIIYLIFVNPQISMISDQACLFGFNNVLRKLQEKMYVEVFHLM